MATEFTLHALEDAEDGDDEVGVLPVFDYTDWTFDLLVTRRSGTSPTLDVTVQEAPLDDDDEYQDLVAFTQADTNTTLPFEETKKGGGADYTMPAGARFVRVEQRVGGTNPEWRYLVTATVTLFNTGKTAHASLLQDRYADHSDLADKAAQAEDDVVSRYLRDPESDRERPWPTDLDLELSETAPDRLELRVDEHTGRRVREAIARRIEWIIRRDELEGSTKSPDGPLLRRHMADEWDDVDEILRHHDSSTPLYAI